MNIFELARSAGVTPSVVRFYARSGAFPQPHPQPDGRLGYDERDVVRLRLAVTLHRLGADVAERIAAIDPQPGTGPEQASGMPKSRAVPESRRHPAGAGRDSALMKMPSEDGGR